METSLLWFIKRDRLLYACWDTRSSATSVSCIFQKLLRVILVRHRKGRSLEPCLDGKLMLKVRGVFAQGWRSPLRRRVQKVSALLYTLI